MNCQLSYFLKHDNPGNNLLVSEFYLSKSQVNLQYLLDEFTIEQIRSFRSNKIQIWLI